MTALLERWPHQLSGVSDTIQGRAEGFRVQVVTSPTGGGKCLAPGTPILMLDGTIKAVEDVAVGDLLMGPDSEPRIVFGTTTGVGPMYRVDQCRGNTYFVNDKHILSVKLTNGGEYERSKTLNIGVQDYLAASNTFRHRAKGYRVGVDFVPTPVPLDPYFLGVWLGDGNSSGQTVTTADEEIAACVADTATACGSRVVEVGRRGKAVSLAISGAKGRGNGSPVRAALRSLGLLGNKHVPHSYKANSRAVRLSVLAGLIDTDGHLHRAGCYDLVFKSQRLAEDVAFLARSLGFASMVRPCQKTCTNNGKVGTYFRVSVLGNVDEIPVRLPRRVSPPRRQKKDHLVNGLTVTPAGLGRYYGFQVSGDGLFLLGDFTVTHNSAMMCDTIDDSLTRDEQSVLYSNRKMLVEQIVRVMERHGITHGVRAAGYGYRRADVQVSSIQTEHSRVMKRQKMDLHDARLVLVDEGHIQKGEAAQAIYRRHLDGGADLVLYTATPIDMGLIAGVEPRLVVAGTNSQLRDCGALVWAHHYGPDEPDTRKIRKQPWEYTENDVRKLIMVQGIFGRVLAEWQRLNPDQLPTILFAPGVAESIWFAEEFRKAGISAAHVDGKECWVDGEFHPSTREIRDQILAGSKDGSIKVLCNRFVLREGIDAPWLAHGIFATVFGSLQSYLQSGGRLLRAHPSLEAVTIQDHGGNWHRHGSLNADRVWNLSYTESMHHGLREERLRNKEEKEPFLCPQCKKVLSKPDCPCGFKVQRKTRPVVQADGTIRDHEGDIYKPRRVLMKHDTEKLWKGYYHRAFRSRNRMTFRQARGLFFYEHHYYPPDNLPLMPLSKMDWFMPVADVPPERLRK